MATIVNIVEKGKRIELINTAGKMVVFTDGSDGCHYEVMDISGQYATGKASGLKDARHSAMEFLEKKGHKALAEKLSPGYKPQRRPRATVPGYGAA